MGRIELGDTKKIQLNPRDVYEDAKWLFLLTGFAPRSDPPYTCYVISLFLWIGLMICLILYQIYLAVPDSNDVIDTLHFYMGTVWVGLVVTVRRLTDKSLMKMREMSNRGIYHYAEEDPDEDLAGIQEDVSSELKRRWNVFIYMYMCAYLVTTVISPTLECVYYADQSPRKINPFLPHPFYLPFDTRGSAGYAVAYFLDSVFWLFSVAVITNAFRMVVFGSVQMKLHLRVLNHSIRNIQRRAVIMYARAEKRGSGGSRKILVETDGFQRCLRACLRANIEHHQSLLRYKKQCMPFFGTIFVGVFTSLTIVLYAALLYLIMQDFPISTKLKYLGMYIAEMSCTLISCMVVEEVREESGNLFESLYSTPWYNYGKGFKKVLAIMMSSTKDPIELRTLILDGKASMEDFGKQCQATYSLMNLMAANH